MREDRVHQFFLGGFEVHRHDEALDQFGHFGADHVRAEQLAGLLVEDGLDEALILAETDESRSEEAKRELRYWRTRKATALIAPPPPADEVGFGSRVTFRLRGALRTLDIVGDDESDPPSGRIAFSAPLARALIGGMVGDRVDFGGEAEAIEILATGAIEG